PVDRRQRPGLDRQVGQPLVVHLGRDVEPADGVEQALELLAHALLAAPELGIALETLGRAHLGRTALAHRRARAARATVAKGWARTTRTPIAKRRARATWATVTERGA